MSASTFFHIILYDTISDFVAIWKRNSPRLKRVFCCFIIMLSSMLIDE